ncbi:MAG: histidine kinase [Clostridia bacterium]
MNEIENLIIAFDYMLDTKRKRHITGGILLSVAMLFGGLAFTVVTIKNEEVNDDE